MFIFFNGRLLTSHGHAERFLRLKCMFHRLSEMLACARVMLLHVSSVEIKCLPCKQRMVIVRAEFGSKQSHEIGHRVDKLCQVFINMFSTCFFFPGKSMGVDMQSM